MTYVFIMDRCHTGRKMDITDWYSIFVGDTEPQISKRDNVYAPSDETRGREVWFRREEAICEE